MIGRYQSPRRNTGRGGGGTPLAWLHQADCAERPLWSRRVGWQSVETSGAPTSGVSCLFGLDSSGPSSPDAAATRIQPGGFRSVDVLTWRRYTLAPSQHSGRWKPWMRSSSCCRLVGRTRRRLDTALSPGSRGLTPPLRALASAASQSGPGEGDPARCHTHWGRSRRTRRRWGVLSSTRPPAPFPGSRAPGDLDQ